MPHDIPEIHEFLKIPNKSVDRDGRLTEFLQLYNKASKTEVKEKEPCLPGEDCSDLVSECCSAILTTVFGTLPLEVKCTSCGRCYVLREILASEKA